MKTLSLKFLLLATALAFATSLSGPRLRAEDGGSAPTAAVAPAENSGPPIDSAATPDAPTKKDKGNKKGKKKKKKKKKSDDGAHTAPPAAAPLPTPPAV
jgi:hypothetical protein